MTLPSSSFAFAAGAGVLLMAAAVSDMRRFTIPNWVVLALVALYVARCGAAAIAGQALAPMALPALPALAVLAAGAFAFGRGWLGGGDVKLLAAGSLWMPAGQILDFLALVALFGGVLAAFVVLGDWLLRPVAAGQADGRPRADTRLPYGVAIAGAGLAVLFGFVSL